MALLILDSAGLLVRSFAALQRVDPGFRSDSVLSMYTSLPRATYDSAAKIVSFYSRLQTAARALPGVTAASGIYPLPMGGERWNGSFDIEGLAIGGLEGPHADLAAALPGYFTAMRIPVLHGRDFAADDDARSQPVAVMLMIVLFGLAALGLASIGMYGVMAYLVAQRTREIGIRIALGGAPGHVRRLVPRESVGIVFAGVAVGITCTLATAGTLSHMLFGVSATDPLTYAAIAMLLLVVGLLAAFGPARRATRIDPLSALRE